MWLLLTNWVRKQLGYHVCEEFTRWEVKQQNYTRLPTTGEVLRGILTRVEFTNHWQERQCTICGKVEQQELDYGDEESGQ